MVADRWKSSNQSRRVYASSSTRTAITALVDARNVGDIEAALACYEDEPTVVAQPGTVLTGREGARAALAGFVSLVPDFTVSARSFLETADVALHYSHWILKAGPDGTAFEVSGKSTDVFRRQPDGGWLLAIDNPYGTDVIG